MKTYYHHIKINVIEYNKKIDEIALQFPGISMMIEILKAYWGFPKF